LHFSPHFAPLSGCEKIERPFGGQFPRPIHLIMFVQRCSWTTQSLMARNEFERDLFAQFVGF
jgi:hypothetical protein